MSLKGCDYAWERPDPKALYDNGYRFVCRYLSYDTTGKNLTATERDTLWRGGLSIVLNWEYSATATLKGFSQGAADATRARDMAAALGAPDTVPIYFSVDFFPLDEALPAILSYFRSCAATLGWARTGAYGGLKIVKYLADQRAVQWFWQTYAWSGGVWDPRAQLRQTANGVPFEGVHIDNNEAVAVQFGQWDPPSGWNGGIVALTDDERARLDNADDNAWATRMLVDNPVHPNNNLSVPSQAPGNALRDALVGLKAQCGANGSGISALSVRLAALEQGLADVKAALAAGTLSDAGVAAELIRQLKG